MNVRRQSSTGSQKVSIKLTEPNGMKFLDNSKETVGAGNNGTNASRLEGLD